MDPVDQVKSVAGRIRNLEAQLAKLRFETLPDAVIAADAAGIMRKDSAAQLGVSTEWVRLLVKQRLEQLQKTEQPEAA